MGSIFIFIVGVLFGWLLKWLNNRMNVIGTLRVDRSDPDFQSLYLEIDHGKSGRLYASDYIYLRVNISQK